MAYGFVLLGLIYVLPSLGLRFWQRSLIYRPADEHALQPDNPTFNYIFEDVWMSIPDTHEQLHGWWIPSAAQPDDSPLVLPNEPSNILTSPRVILYLCGVGRNMGDYNYLARVSAFRQLGFSVLVFDYRGYGLSEGGTPNESQVYQDSQAAWAYLQDELQIPPNQIYIYGESLGGAIAIDLALRQPNAAGLIVQSSFTSMAAAIREKAFLQIFPIDLLLTERFDSLSKVRSLQMPVLFLHGSTDSVVPAEMGQQLYDEAPEPKQLFRILGADHVRIYQPDEQSYLKVIQRFVESAQ